MPLHYSRPGPGMYNSVANLGKRSIISQFTNAPISVIKEPLQFKFLKNQQKLKSDFTQKLKENVFENVRK